MKIAFYDNLANNAYIEAKTLRATGTAVDLLLDPSDPFVMSDPRWEDGDFVIPNDQSLTYRFSESQVLPEWVHDLKQPTTRFQKIWFLLTHPRAVWWMVKHAGWRGLVILASGMRAVEELRKYDFIVSYGTGGIFARATGRPLLVKTYGGDVTLVPFYDQDPQRSAYDHAWARLQRAAYQEATRICLSEPRYQEAIDRLHLQDRSVFQPLVVDVHKYAPDDGDEMAAQLRRRLLGKDKTYLFFVPSRQDYYWKGSDLLLRGLAKALKGRTDCLVLAAGWGNDLDRARHLAEELGIADQIIYQAEIFSKTRLLHYYRAADLVFDQFTLGTYGTSALEAMATGTPLITYIKEGDYAPYFDTPIPVLNAQTEDEIAENLVSFLKDPKRVRLIGTEARNWVIRYHYTDTLQRLQEYLDV